MNIRKIIANTSIAIHLGLVVITIALAILSFVRPDLIREGIEWMGVHIKSWGSWNYVIIFLTAIAESFPFVGSAIPGMNIMILVGGFFIVKQWELFPSVLALAVLGACLGNALGFFMGLSFGKKFLEKYGVWFGVGPNELVWLEKTIHKNGFWFLLGAKFHNLLRSFIPYLAGAHNFSGSRFWLANILGSIVWSVTILLIGIFAVENYERILQYLNYIVIGVIAVAIFIWWRKNKNKTSL